MGTLTGKVAVVTVPVAALVKVLRLYCRAGRDGIRNGPHSRSRVESIARDCRRDRLRVSARGGEGIAVAVDHANDEQVAALFAQVKRERAVSISWSQRDRHPGGTHAARGVLAKTDFELGDDRCRRSVEFCGGLACRADDGTAKVRPHRRVVGICGRHLYHERRVRHVQNGDRPDGAGHGGRTQASQCSFAFTVARVHVHRAREENLKNVPGMAASLNSPAGSSVEFPGRVIAALACDPDLMNALVERSSRRNSRRTMGLGTSMAE